MFYHTHNTEAFVLTALPSGESSKYVYLFTKDLGLVGAHAQGVRDVKSKLRYALDNLSYSRVSLVRGKNSWRLTNAVPHKNFFLEFRDDQPKLILCANTLALIKKLVAGEEKNHKLFEILDSGFSFLERERLSSDNIKNVEAIFMLRILDNLGYLGDEAVLEQFVLGDAWSHEMLVEMERERRNAVFAINKSLEASHMI